MAVVRKFKKSLAITSALLMVIAMLPGSLLKAQAAEGDKTMLYIDDGAISISGDTAIYNSGMNTVTNTNGFIITQHDSTSPTFWRISVTGGNANITLQNVNINEYLNGIHYYKPGLSIAHGASANLTLSGSNILKGDNSCAGIFVPSGAELTINGTGSLTAISGGNGAGIGGSNSAEYGIGDTSGDDCGTVNIAGGTVTATGSYGGAGIGGGEYTGSGGTVNITGGTVTATGGAGAAGIGGGSDQGNGGMVSISGGTVTAIGGDGGPGIGGGKYNGNAGSTTITGGSVHATDSNGNSGVQGGVKDASGHTEHCVTVDANTLIGSSKSLTASVQNGPFCKMQTDGSGKLYFWMDENATGLATVQYSSDIYRLSVPVGTADTSATLSIAVKMAVLDLSQESITISATSVTAKDANKQDVGLSSSGYVIMQSGSGSTANTISVTGGTQNIVLQNVDIQTSNGSAFSIASGASVNLTLSGTNILKSGNGAGLGVPSGASITVVGGDALTATGCNADEYFNFDGAGIGGAGMVTINGGTLNAYGGFCSTGIGGAGYYPESSDGTVIINGGVIHAYGGENAAGIGAGHNYDNSGSKVTINGGTVTAQGGFDGAGIGGNQGCDAGTVTINGGTVTAYGGADSAGIGGGFASDAGGTVNITGGTVFAKGDRDGGAGIGTGKEPWAGPDFGGGTVNISGGMVQAIGGPYSAGIGGSAYGNGGAVNISGGTVRAVGGGGVAGICGGSQGGAIVVTISGGSVNTTVKAAPANGTNSVYMTTVSLPAGTDVSSLSLQQGGSKYTYGYKDMQADGASYGELYLWLPANTKTTADVTTDGGSYNGYYGTVGTNNNSTLKMDQSTLTISGITGGGIYTYGSIPAVTTSGGSGTGNVTYTYTGTDYSSVGEPSDVGIYSVTAQKAEDACYYASTATASFIIEPKELTGSNVTVTIPEQEYTGSALTPDVTVTYNGAALIEGMDYTVSFINNTGIALSTDPNPPTATITFIGNYTGIINKTFTIEARPAISISHVPDNLNDWSAKIDFTVVAMAGSSGIKSVTVKKDTAETLTDIQATLNDGKYSFTATENGSYTFTVTSNSGFTASQTVETGKIDTAAPAVGNISGNPEIPEQFAALSVKATPGLSGIGSVTVSRYDSGKWTVLTGVSIADAANADGSHTYTYTATENGTYKFTVMSAAGISTDSNSVNVTKIDTVKPAVSISAKNADGSNYDGGTWVSQDVTLNISNTASNLGTAKFEYSMDGGERWTAFDGSITDTDEAATTYQFCATSASGVVSEIQSIAVKIDKTAPTEMAIGFKQNPFKTVAHFLTFGIFFGDTVDVNFSAADNGSGIDHYEYQTVAGGDKLNTDGWNTGSLSISPNFKGSIYAQAVDKAGNVSGTVTESLVVDKTAPTITVPQTTLTTTSPSASIPVAVEDNGAGVSTVTYQVNGGSVQNIDLTEGVSDSMGEYSFSIDSLPDGIYDVVINAQDNSGNSAASVTVHVNKDTTPKVTDVTVTPSSVSVDHGAVQIFAAAVTGINNPPTDVTWSVSGNRSSGTTIDANGKLTVAADESTIALTITATSVYDKTKSEQAAITVNTSDQIGFSFTSSSVKKTCSDMPFTIDATGGQGVGAIIYTVTSGQDAVSINGNTVTVKKVGAAVITAIKAADGSFRQATAAINVYIGKGTPDVTTLPAASKINVIGGLSSCKLTGGSADIPGTFEWTNPDAVVTESENYEVTFIPADTTDYNSRTCMVKVTVNPVVSDSLSDVAFDLTGVTLPNGVTSVSVGSSIEPKSNGSSAYSIVEDQIGSEEKLNGLTVYNLKLLDQNGNPIETFSGKIMVKIPIPDGMGGDLNVYWYNDADGTVTDMNAKQESGYLVFETTHFNYYAVAELSAKSSSGSGTIPNPDTGSDPLQSMPVALLGISGFGLTVITRSRRFRKKD